MMTRSFNDTTDLECFPWPILSRNKLKFDWEGALADLRDKYTSVELQHKALEWWGD